MSAIPSLSTGSFYGKSLLNIPELCPNNSEKSKSIIRYTPRNLLHGPNLLWKVFYMQDGALSFMQQCRDGLMCFAFEHSDPGRLFLVAHPEVFWHYDQQRDSDLRCTYEIITEFTACKLYIDLEFDISLNQERDGYKMVDTFISLLFLHLEQLWNIVCKRDQMLILDSSTKSKFSCHLVLNATTFCFADNYHVGHFVKHVCQNVRNILEEGSLPSFMDSIITIEDIKNLTVIDTKGNSRIFCDEGVYTKNRHFRLYASTKKGKHSNLVLSKDNEFKTNSELDTFLCSLITYFNASDSTKILELGNSSTQIKGKPSSLITNREHTPSPYPLVDQFISNLVDPGKIYRNTYFGTKRLILYDIIGNRYCGNIGRAHKSNNVKYVVDLKECVYYQKCYDFECAQYRSEKMVLPPEISFGVSDNSDIYGIDNNHGIFGLSASDTDQVLDALEAIGNSQSVSRKELKRFPSFGLSDEDFLKISCESDSTVMKE